MFEKLCQEALGALLFENLGLRAQVAVMAGKVKELEEKLEKLDEALNDTPKEASAKDGPAV